MTPQHQGSQRRHPRHPYQVPVLARSAGSPEGAFGRLEKIGRGGCGFVCDHPFETGEPLGLEICLGGGTLRARARVVYRRPGGEGLWEVGARFVGVHEADLPLLDLALDEAAGPPPPQLD